MTNGEQLINTALLDSQQRLIDDAQKLIDQPNRERLSIDIHKKLLEIPRIALVYQRAMNERIKVLEHRNKELQNVIPLHPVLRLMLQYPKFTLLVLMGKNGYDVGAWIISIIS